MRNWYSDPVKTQFQKWKTDWEFGDSFVKVQAQNDLPRYSWLLTESYFHTIKIETHKKPLRIKYQPNHDGAIRKCENVHNKIKCLSF